MTRQGVLAPNQLNPVRYIRADCLGPDDIITDQSGVYRVLGVSTYSAEGALIEYVHVQVSTIAGAIKGGLMRSPNELVPVFATVEPDPSIGVEGTPRRD